MGRRGVPRRDRRAGSIPAGAAGRVAWVLSNHDFPRLPDRVRRAQRPRRRLARAHAPGRRSSSTRATRSGWPTARRRPARRPRRPRPPPPPDALGRRCAARRLLDAEPWLPAIDVDGGAVARRRATPTRCSRLYRDLIALRRALGAGLEFLDDVDDGMLAYRRGDGHLVALNLTDEPRPRRRRGGDPARDARRAPPAEALPPRPCLGPARGFWRGRSP